MPDYGLEGADEETFATDFLTDRAIDYINSPRDESQPFLLFLSYPDPHGPNSVRAPYDHRFDELIEPGTARHMERFVECA